MSELSLIIENQNEVMIDESFLEKCKADNEKQPSKHLVASSHLLSSKELKLNKNSVSYTHLTLPTTPYV